MELEKFIGMRVADSQDLIIDRETFDAGRISKLALKFVEVFSSGNKVAFLGNGGSAAEAMHIAAEFTGKCVRDHAPLSAICLNESQSALTAISNDYGIENLFSRQVQAHLKPNDLLIALSTSGKSPNVLNAINSALLLGAEVIFWTGKTEYVNPLVDHWAVRSTSTPRIQEIHLMWGHLIAETVEEIIS